jgi:hypothetical protein
VADLDDVSQPDTLLLLQRQALDYRYKAEELRNAGGQTRSPEARGILLALADDAFRMAERVEMKLQSLAARAAR